MYNRQHQVGRAGVFCIQILCILLSSLSGWITVPSFAQHPAGKASTAKASQRPNRDVYGDLLPAGAIGRFGTTRLRLPGVVVKGFTSDGKAIFGSGDAAACLWDVRSGRELLRIPRQEDASFQCAILSPNGRQILYGTNPATVPATVHIWDIERQAVVRCYRGYKRGSLTDIAVDRKFRFVAVSFKGILPAPTEEDQAAKPTHQVHLWDPQTGQLLRRLGPTRDPVKQIAVSPDGRLVAGVTFDQVLLWRTATGQLLWDVRNKDAGFKHIQFSPDGALLAVVWHDKTFDVWDVAAGKRRRQLRGHTDTVNAVCFSPDGKMTASSSEDRTLRLWDVATGREVRRRSIDFRAYSLVFSPDGAECAGDCGHAICFWEVATLRERRPCAGHLSDVYALALSPDGTQLLSASPAATLRCWDYTSMKEVRQAKATTWVHRRLVYSPDGTTFACQSPEDRVLLFDAGNCRLRQQLALKGGPLCGMVFSSDGLRLFSVSHDRTLQVWDVRTGEAIHSWDRPPSGPQPRRYPPDGLALSPDNRILAVPELTSLVLVDAQTGKTIRAFPLDTSFIMPPVFLPDGETVVIVHSKDEKTISQCSVRTGRVHTYSLTEYPDGLRACAISPDGKLLATGASEVTLWELATGEKLRSFSGHRGTVSSMVFSRDGLAVLSGSEDTTVLLWDIVGRVAPRHSRFQHLLEQKDFEALWEKLVAGKAPEAWGAIWAFAAHPKEALPLFRKRLTPVPRINVAEFTRLVGQLDDASFDVRVRATHSLTRLGDTAYPRLQTILKSDTITLETRKRIQIILEDPDNAARVLRHQRVIAALEYMCCSDADVLLKQLADGEPDASLTKEAKAALLRRCRLSRTR